LDETRAAMRRAATAATVKGDPLAQVLEALSDTLGTLGEIYNASAETQLEIATNLRTQAGAVADEAIERVHASGLGIIEQLAPRLAVVVEQTARTNRKTRLVRAILGGTGGLVIGLALIAGVSYTAGFASGRNRGEITAHTISAAMAAGPDAATAWAGLMANNDPVQALAACKRNVSVDAHGRRYCALPVWLDPPSPPNGK
jgi:hypothetical protein